MRHAKTRAGLSTSVALVLAAAGCSSPEVTAAELAPVIERDAIPFDGPEIPEQVIERLASNRVIVLGETHHLREHYEFTTELLRELHDRGFRQLLVEQPQMADWWLEAYSVAGSEEPQLEPPANWRTKYDALREYNATLPAGDRIHVRAIDVNETYYGGGESFRALLELLVGRLGEAGPVREFLAAGYDTPEAQAEAIGALSGSLEADRSALAAAWGSDRYDRILEMVDVEQTSIDIRADREDHYDRAARDREDVIKQLADARIAGYPHGTVINIGGHHAQKSQLMGTEQEWLGDYLVHRSEAIDGTVEVVVFTSARTELEPGATGTAWDILNSSSPDNELFRLMAETFPDRTVYLPLDAPLFGDGRIAVNSEDVIYLTPFREQYDAVLQYGVAHRVPVE